MADWTTFAGVIGVVLLVLLVLSRLTERSLSPVEAGGRGSERVDDQTTGRAEDLTPGSEGGRTAGREGDPESATDVRDLAAGDDRTGTPARNGRRKAASDPSESGEREAATTPSVGRPTESADGSRSTDDEPAARVDGRPVSTAALFANVALTQGVFAVAVLGAVVYTDVPASALGIEFTGSYLETGLLLGTGLGLVCYVANEGGAALVERAGIDHNEALREMLAPDSVGGWVLLLTVVLPVIAVFEELLFRAALVGALSVGFDVSPWLLAVASSVAFAVGHGVQGTAGIVVTGLLGFVLAAAFVLTGSLLVVIVAHYVINAAEFVVHEGLGIEWIEAERAPE